MDTFTTHTHAPEILAKQWYTPDGVPIVPTLGQLHDAAWAEGAPNVSGLGELSAAVRKTFTGGAVAVTVKARSLVYECIAAATGGMAGAALTQLARTLYVRLIGF